jgi:hypothetical protein
MADREWQPVGNHTFKHGDKIRTRHGMEQEVIKIVYEACGRTTVGTSHFEWLVSKDGYKAIGDPFDIVSVLKQKPEEANLCLKDIEKRLSRLEVLILGDI